jgi:hypothetical protein
MDELELGCLLSDGVGNCRAAVANEIDGRAASKIEILVAFRVPQVNALATHGLWIAFV